MILAPMQGLTEVLFRRVYEECFPGAIALAVSPFLSLTHNLQNARPATRNAILDDVLPQNNTGSIAVIPQILGKEPEEFITLGNRLYDLGYNEVNWNMGCPMRKVTSKHRGSGILPYPDEVDRILDKVLPFLRPKLSIKTRLGLKDKKEIFNLVPIINRYPLLSVTIHPRLGRQQYGGVPDLETFGEVLPMIKHPVIYNGDIRTVANYRNITERFATIADVMIGRGVLYSPTLPLEIPADANTEINDEWREKEAKRFIRRLMEEINHRLPTEEGIMRKKKEYWCLLWKSLHISEMTAREVLRQTISTDVDKLISDLTQ